MAKRLLALSALLPILALIGCQQQTFVAAPNPYPIGAAQYKVIFNASIQVLRDRGFRINRKDYRFGRITTYPCTSPTILEPWRDQNATMKLALDSTLNDLARKVTIFLSPTTTATPATPAPVRSALARQAAPTTARPGGYTLRVEVMLERCEQPTRRLTGAAGPYVFNSLSAVPEEMKRRGITADCWQPVKRDLELENQLINQIVRRAYRFN